MTLGVKFKKLEKQLEKQFALENKLIEKATQLEAELAECRKQRDGLAVRVQVVVEALESVEWICMGINENNYRSYFAYCPCCKRIEPYHYDKCELQAALTSVQDDGFPE